MISRRNHRLAALVLVGIGISTTGCSAADGDDGHRADGPAAGPLVVDGALSPGELGFEVNRLEQHAAVGQLVDGHLTTSQGCSGTLVGDRVVVTAGHCVVMNHDEWFDGGEPALDSNPGNFHFPIGDHVREPLCETTAESIHLHPDIEVQSMSIAHDFAVVILEESVWESCESVIPIQLNRDTAGEELVGEMALQGGFGSIDGTYAFSPQRFWSLVEITDVDDYHVTVQDIDQGFPTYGDSGSGLWLRFEDGSLRTLGQCSSGMGGVMRFSSTDVQTALLDEVVDQTLLCGPVDETGTCRDDLVVRCDAQGFSSIDCRATEEQCVVGDDGTPSCVCACDIEPYCQEDCSCDADCPCECDQSESCDQGCDCDPDCYGEPAPAPEPADGGEDEGGCALSPSPADGAPAHSGLLLGLGLLGWSLRRRRR